MTSADVSSSRSPLRPPPSRVLNLSALTAIASLIVALVFNAIQARDTANQAGATRLATELQLLTQLNGLVTQSQTTLNPRSSQFIRAEQTSYQLPTAVNTNFRATLINLNYLAWLFNNGFISVPGARQQWQRGMDCLYATAILVYGQSVSGRLPALARFVHPGRGRQIVDLRNATC